MKFFVIGGGPAGMLSAIFAARNGAEVTLIEKNEKLGKKLYITGKGRCNLTNCSGFDDYMANVVSNKKFMFSSLKEFDAKRCMDFFESIGLPLKVERGNRVFPQSDKSSDVIKALQRELTRLNVDVRLNEKVTKINGDNGTITSIVTDKNTYVPDKVLIATGGVSYPATGSTGDGYNFAKKLGHNVIPSAPALVGIKLKYGITVHNKATIQLSQLGKLQGLSLKNVSAKIIDKDTNKVLFEEFGEMLFTAKGVSGPIILTLSSKINRLNLSSLLLSIDLKPALNEQQLDNRIVRDFTQNSNKMLKNVLSLLVPSSLITSIIKLSGINGEKFVNTVTKVERKNLITSLKNLTFDLDDFEDISTAIVTAGGIDIKEINPKTMQSKIIKNLYFAGEVIDVDALTGGYNLQIAFSTAYSVSKYINE